VRIIDDLLATLTPPLGLDLQSRPDVPVREVWIGAFWTAVVLEASVQRGLPSVRRGLLTEARCGLASALREDDHHRHGQHPVREAGHLHERSALELAELARSDSLLEASIGLAAINALLDVDEEACVELNAEQVILDQIRSVRSPDLRSARSPDRSRVVVVGHFPFIPRVREAASQLWVLEKHPGEGDLPAEAASEVIPQADVVAITGTSLINHTFEELMGLCRPEAFVLVLGPTAPLSPVLFNYGVDVISGTLVTEPETVLRYVSQGGSFRQIKRSKGVKLLTLAKEALQE
jgi:uncharacterized protein (DUF4213/DUF364 family)